jgi:Raf kinase inhibitor-like YbhB/YbcL family protein
VGARRALVVAALAAALAGCGGDGDEPPAPEIPKTITLSTPAFKDGGAIPAALTCDGDGTKPPTIVWRAAPADSIELVVVVEDPDASDGTFTHWTVYGVASAAGSGLAPDGQFPAGVKQGRNSAGKDGWTPPCPPEGDDAHRYVFSMYALPKASGLEPGAEPEAVKAAIESATAYGTFSGTYQRAN